MRTQNLPLYTSAFILAREIYRIKVKLPKTLKYDLGQEAFQSTIKVLKCVVIANRAHDKARHITRLLLEIEVQWVLLRLLYCKISSHRSHLISCDGIHLIS